VTSSPPEVTAFYTYLEQPNKYAWRFFMGRLMIGGWVLSPQQHEVMEKWAADVGLSLTREARMPSPDAAAQEEA
jgi:hypothetical protein